jgi:hypothetical protein
VAAIREFDLYLSQLHWDLTSVVLQGEYPPEEQQRDYPKPAYGFGGEPNCKQLRVGELVTNDGGVPVWHRSFDGQQADVGTVVAQMETLRAHVSLPECVVIGDSKLLSATVIERLRRQQLHFLAPLPKSAALDAAFLALDPAGWQPLDYLAKRQERLAPEARTQYQGQEVVWEWVDPQSGESETFRRLFVISSEERATCRKVRAQQMAKAEAELAKMAAGIADDLATTLLLATDKPVVVAPAMNVRMWLHAATRRNVQQLVEDGVQVIEPAEGEMACGEHGPGRLPEPQEIIDWLSQNGFLGSK